MEVRRLEVGTQKADVRPLLHRPLTSKKRKVYVMKTQPQRTCMGCNEKKDKKDLIRIVKSKDNEISIDKTGKKEGRGAYICDDEKCLEKVFEMQITQEIYESLRGVILDK